MKYFHAQLIRVNSFINELFLLFFKHPAAGVGTRAVFDVVEVVASKRRHSSLLQLYVLLRCYLPINNAQSVKNFEADALFRLSLLDFFLGISFRNTRLEEAAAQFVLDAAPADAHANYLVEAATDCLEMISEGIQEAADYDKYECEK